MHPTLARVLETVRSATEGVADEPPRPEGTGPWSPAQIVEHLALGWRLTALGTRAALSQGRPRARRRRLKDRLVCGVVLGLGRFPGRPKSPAAAVPRGLPLAEAWSAAQSHLADLDEALTAAEERFGRKAVLDHPVLGPLTARQWRRFHLVHALHHARQISTRTGGPVRPSSTRSCDAP